MWAVSQPGASEAIWVAQGLQPWAGKGPRTAGLCSRDRDGLGYATGGLNAEWVRQLSAVHAGDDWPL